jgi:hypothetical protein
MNELTEDRNGEGSYGALSARRRGVRPALQSLRSVVHRSPSTSPSREGGFAYQCSRPCDPALGPRLRSRCDDLLWSGLAARPGSSRRANVAPCPADYVGHLCDERFRFSTFQAPNGTSPDAAGASGPVPSSNRRLPLGPRHRISHLNDPCFGSFVGSRPAHCCWLGTGWSGLVYGVAFTLPLAIIVLAEHEVALSSSERSPEPRQVRRRTLPDGARVVAHLLNVARQARLVSGVALVAATVFTVLEVIPR